MLNDQKEKIKGELECHLQEREPIDIGMKEQPDDVDYKDEGTHYEPKTENFNGNISEVLKKTKFQNKLLILGSPGSGTTVTLLRFAEYLIESAENDSTKPIPYICYLSSWKNEPIDKWLIKELGSYKKVGLNKILPMLDGLHLLAPNRQEHCIKQINRVLINKKVIHLFVCSRKDAYACSSRNQLLKLKGAVCLQPLDDKQIENFLTGIGCDDIWNVVKPNNNLKKLFRVPLLLYKIIQRYKDQNNNSSADGWQKLSPEEKLRSCIFYYIEHEIDKQQQKEYKKEKILKYILWLLLLFNLNSEYFNKNLFTIYALQPSWLSRKYLWFYRACVGVISLIPCMIIPLIVGQESRIIFFLLLVTSLILGLGIIWTTQIKLVWTLKWSFSQAINNTKKYGFTILVSALIGGVILAIFIRCDLFFVETLSIVISALLMSGLDSIKPDDNRGSNQGIWQSAKNSIIGLVIGLIAGIILWRISVSTGETSLIGVKIIPILGILFCLITGGITCIQHFCLRLTLYWSGCIPWNYNKFLTHATKLNLLERVGGAYRFVFDQLRDQLVETLNRVQKEEGSL